VPDIEGCENSFQLQLTFDRFEVLAVVLQQIECSGLCHCTAGYAVLGVLKGEGDAVTLQKVRNWSPSDTV
jgi:hypothetical protein